MGEARRPFRRSHRLYFRIWLAVLAGLAAVTMLLALAWYNFYEPGHSMEIGLTAETGERIGTARIEQLPDARSLWMPAWRIRMPDGTTLVARPERNEHRRHPPFGFLAALALIALAVGASAYPLVRRLTRRLERLETSVDALGAGDLSARVAVEGNDEVARLAERFNAAAQRIETLVAAQKTMLANASHELRSPLARIRMALEMLGPNVATQTSARREIERDIVELDQLIDEILLASRIDGSAPAADPIEDIDLAGLAAEECARAGAQFEGVVATVRGNARLLRRLIRNLLENARRHGGGNPAEVVLRPVDGGVEIDVCDRGPGVPEAERERIFEPFYRLPGAREGDGGAGLGLSLVRQIARKHGGDVACLAREGGGSCFRVRLPRQGAVQ